MRSLALLLICSVAVTACNYDANRSVDELIGAAVEAGQAGDARTYIRLARAAAEYDHLGSLRLLATSAQQGYVRLGDQDEQTLKAVWFWPGEGARWERRYEETLARQAASGSLEARFLLLSDNHDGGFSMGIGSENRPDNSNAINAKLLQLAKEGYGPAMLFTAMRQARKDPSSARDWFVRAADAGQKDACLIGAATLRRSGDSPAASTSRFLDEAMACKGGEVVARERLAKLYAEEARGNEAATALLDSLVAFGVFERHPGLPAGRS